MDLPFDDHRSGAVFAGDYEALAAEFDASALNSHELRAIQRALVFTGDYDGLVDGKWGPKSQRALESFSIRELDRIIVTNGVVAVLFGRGLRDIDESGAEVVAPDGYHMQIELPMTVVRLEESGAVGVTYRSDSRDLAIMIERHGEAAPVDFHSELRRNFIVGAEPVLVDRDKRLVSSFSADGFATYIRSDQTPLGWVSVSLFAKGPANVRRLKIIASTISFDPDTRWLSLDRPALMGIIKETDASGEGVGRASQDERAYSAFTAERVFAGLDQGGGLDEGNVGTGFFVTETDIITNSHVVGGCAEVETTDGQLLKIAFTDPVTDLALLTGAQRSRAWLPVAPTREIRLGRETYLLGFPYYGLTTRAISFTRGIISSRSGLGGSAANFTLTAPMQPGNSGGPVLDRSGQVIGVAVARISDFAVAQATGTLPQNINYAVTGEALNQFLEKARVALAQRSDGLVDLRENGVPEWIEAAVIPIVCR